jgi:cell division protein FtsZ
VGDTVEEFASADATVVVGTVIDPEMTDELRVTVVATGLGVPQTAERPQPTKVVVDNTKRSAATGQPDYAELDKPAVMRAAASQGSAATAQPLPEDRDMEYLDIPAFLRRQAD